MDVLDALCSHYHWPHDFWRRMGWRELRSWLAAMRRAREAQASAVVTAPGSWSGAEGDPFWQQARRRRT